jgi:hypothetical protein
MPTMPIRNVIRQRPVPIEPPIIIERQRDDRIFTNMESVINTISSSMPIGTHELWYRMELETAAKVYGILMAIGLLLSATILLLAFEVG